MATVEVAAPVALIASEELVKVIDEDVKVTEIEPMTEKATEEEAPPEEVPATEKTVDERPATFEKSAEELIVATSALEPEAELALLKSEEAAQVPDEAEQGKEVSVAEAHSQLYALYGCKSQPFKYWLVKKI